ncbi:GNAT family N-acetyltransferase [Lactococcus formosensis]|uniref:GNAT family N-acetyltransferase n=1 Tax=Lactococcus formosensis TaxID=1281486 RepID=UPI0002E205B6|nr:GNAT family N-acetyltransferase [Lactococcus formosensis]MCH1722384.1 GNAT family N-acetyltransferase [Lactococcus formosensis]MDG6114406.1 GNAT family N-acetyltransferase [Lactococcus formosensis]MDG6116331.1 GNAT family N-acetyltransferase [Lactococcus formosensis]MDG6122700.1 GNAT family N-acetyltransferase [Lactococcus formosensis]MDG6124787.1 GNAT family N-acetyltransferase [Lactococcus formosensis]
MILSIQKDEFGVGVDLADQPDLQDIHAHYSQFWLAVDEEKGVVGTLGIVKFNAQQAVLKKMFVNVEYRGKSVAQLLLDNLFEYCRIEDIKEIYLGTVEQFKAAHRFYEKNDFILINEKMLPEDMPRMEVDTIFYEKISRN